MDSDPFAAARLRMTAGAAARLRMTTGAAARLKMTTGAAARLRMTTGAAVMSAIGFAILGGQLDFDRPTAVDRRIRRLAQDPSLDALRAALKPLFPVGLPIGYITIAYATRRWMHRRGKHGSRAIIAAAWLGWLVHRAVKLGYFRERPPKADARRRTDSYPSGHTTGTTSLAVAMALVLEQTGALSRDRSTALAFAAPAVMGAYRVLADDHWATDVVGGWLLGTSIGLGCYAALGEKSRRAPRVVRSNRATAEIRTESTSRRPRRHAHQA